MHSFICLLNISHTCNLCHNIKALVISTAWEKYYCSPCLQFWVLLSASVSVAKYSWKLGQTLQLVSGVGCHKSICQTAGAGGTDGWKLVSMIELQQQHQEQLAWEQQQRQEEQFGHLLEEQQQQGVVGRTPGSAESWKETEEGAQAWNKAFQSFVTVTIWIYPLIDSSPYRCRWKCAQSWCHTAASSLWWSFIVGHIHHTVRDVGRAKPLVGGGESDAAGHEFERSGINGFVKPTSGSTKQLQDTGDTPREPFWDSAPSRAQQNEA